MMLDSPHTSVPMLMRGNTLPQRDLHPTNHVQQETHPTDNLPQNFVSVRTIKGGSSPTQQTTCHSLQGRTGRERPDVEADSNEGCPREQAATDRVVCDTAPHQHQTPLPATRLSPHLAASRHGQWGHHRPPLRGHQCECTNFAKYQILRNIPGKKEDPYPTRTAL